MKKFISVILAVMTAAVFVGTGVKSAVFPGDCNGDGTIDNKDVVTLFRYVSGTDVSVVTENCDYNRDGEIDNKDVATLFRAVSSGAAATQQDTEDMTTEIILDDYDFLSQEMDVSYRFTGISSSQGVFALHRDAVSSGDTVTFPSDTVSGIYPTFSVSENTVTEYTFEVKSASSASTYSWFTCYFGLRLETEQADPTRSTGVWIAMRSKQLGLRTNAWPETTYFNIDYDFSKGVLITVKDDPVNDIIYIYAGEEKKEIATVKIDGKNVKLIKSGGGSTISTKTDNNVIKGGYAHIWGHIPEDDIMVKNISLKTKRITGTADNDGIKTGTRDIFSDTWVAFDDTGRVITTSSNKPNGAKVGIFYFLWHETENNKMPIYDHTASYQKGGINELWKTMQSGNLGFAHYWAEPYFGYYASDDEWVIRKHGAMLSEAGIDFVFFDTTNGLLYPKNYEAVLRIWAKMRTEGLKTPDVCFLLQDGNASELSSVWTNVYSVNKYEDLWFRWNGKPVIMFTNNNNSLTNEQKNFFTVKYSWANENDGWYTWKGGIDCWAWGTMYPQKGGYTRVNGKRTLEQMVVMCGFWANGSYGTNAGRSYTSKTGEPKTDSGWDMGYALYPETCGLGLAYQEQFDKALSSSPKLIMITGWNEWWAGRWEGGGATGQLIANEYKVVNDKTAKEYNYYVDNLNPEYSRDIEPMKDGFKDNYYYQTVMNVRNYKGTRQVESAFGQKTIDIKGSAAQWNTVGPEYRDVKGDVFHRNHLSHVGKMTYKNDTGRNDIITAKVSSDAQYLYFYAECADKITDPEGDNWMNLFIKTDGDNENGWYGFDYIINRSRNNGKASVQRFKNGWNFENAGEAEYTLDGKTIVIKLKKTLINTSNGSEFYFKWADNSVNDGDIMGFLDKGDAAPDGRFCYHYTTEATETVVPDCLSDDMAVFKVNGYNAYINGRSEHLYENNTRAVLLASGYDYYLPVKVMEKLGIDCSGEKTYDHYGIPYVKANEAVEKSGKAVTITPDGLLIIADGKITDTATLDILYRSLY